MRLFEKGFKTHGQYQGVGLLLNKITGPGPNPESEFIYTSYSYSKFNIIAIDPKNGSSTVFDSPLDNERAVYGLVAGADGQIYLGTSSNAHLMRLNWETQNIDDLGVPVKSEQYIWGLDLGSDKKIYGCTYPNAKLFCYDPSTGNSVDLGRMDPKEMYARNIAADNSGFVYIGIGMEQRHLVAYEISTGKHADILPDKCKGTGVCTLIKDKDGKVYARSGKYFLSVSKWKAEIIENNPFVDRDKLMLSDGSECIITDDSIKVDSPKTKSFKAFKINNPGNKLEIFRIGLGPDNNIYGSTLLPLNLFKLDSKTNQINKIGRIGNGEIYSFISYKDNLIAGIYAGMAPIIQYKPAEAFNPKNSSDGNPWLIKYAGMNESWRPMAVTLGNDNQIYFGSTPGYGQLDGSLTCFDPLSGHVSQYNEIAKDQSIVSLCLLPDGKLIGGTNINGGGGSHPTQKEAVIFIWDPVLKIKVFEITPIKGKTKIDALSVGSNGLVYGFSDHEFFVFDPYERRIISTASHNLGSIIYNSIDIGPKGFSYGLSNSGIFSIDPKTNQLKLIIKYKKEITGGFALKNGLIYFISGSEIVSYRIK